MLGDRGPQKVGDAVGGAPAGRAGRPVILALDDVRFSYPDGTHVLDGLSLSVAAGTTVGIVGPSGCGKSTLLALIAGLLQPSNGMIERNTREDHGHPLSMVFQKDTLLPWLTAEDNVRLFARFKKHGLKRGPLARLSPGRGSAAEERAELDERVRRLLALTHLSDSAHMYPYQLSGGMRRRLAFLAAVAASPQILLLDEPFSSVDEPTRVGIHQDVFEIARIMNMTTVLITHDLAEAITLCDRVVILTNRPARVAEEQAIPFGEERQMLEIRATSEYADLYGQLWHHLSEQIGAGPRREVAS